MNLDKSLGHMDFMMKLKENMVIAALGDYSWMFLIIYHWLR